MKNNRHGQAAILSDRERLLIRRQLDNPSHRLIFDVANWTGERWGAILQLKVGDAYRDAETSQPHEQITFRAATRKASPAGERQTRQVFCHPSLIEALAAYKPPVDPGGWLFPSVRPGEHITFSAADKWLRVAVDRAGLGDRGISTHSTRRTFITRLSEKGIAIKIIQAVSGHKDVKSLLRYVEIQPGQIREAISLL